MPPEHPEADMTEHDPAVVADDAYLDYLAAGGQPPTDDQVARALAEMRDQAR